MGLFDIFGFGSNINDLVEEARATQNATIIDVRTPAEFKQGHIEEALNIPVDQIQKVEQAVKDPDTPPVFVLCERSKKRKCYSVFTKPRVYPSNQHGRNRIMARRSC